MIADWEFLERDIDLLDDVQRQLDRFYRGDYFHPMNGDLQSDNYALAIELTTQPKPLGEDDHKRLNGVIDHLNDQNESILNRLDNDDLRLVYNGVLAQLNEINAADPSRTDIKSFVISE
jgi:MinD superfamily P-loop ATPase